MVHIWQMAVSIFLIAAAVFLLVFAYVFQGAMISTIALWAAFALFLVGIIKGIYAVIAHHVIE